MSFFFARIFRALCAVLPITKDLQEMSENQAVSDIAFTTSLDQAGSDVPASDPAKDLLEARTAVAAQAAAGYSSAPASTNSPSLEVLRNILSALGHDLSSVWDDAVSLALKAR